MSRDAENKAGKLFKKDMGEADVARGDVNNIMGALVPMYADEAERPEGFSPEDLTAMTTAGEQSVGGAISGAAGQGDLAAARTRNTGGFAPALDESVRGGMRVNSENALGIQRNNAMLKESKRQSGLEGLSHLNDVSIQRLLASLGLGNSSVGTQIAAGKSGWLQNFNDTLATLTGAAKRVVPGGGAGGN